VLKNIYEETKTQTPVPVYPLSLVWVQNLWRQSTWNQKD